MFSAFPSSLTFSHLSQPIYLSLLLLPLSVDPCMRAQNKRNISAATEYSNHILYNQQSVTLTSLHNYADMLADAKKTIELNPTGDWSKGHSCIGAAYLELKCCHIVFLFLLYILCLPLLPYSHLSQPSYFSPFDCSPLIYAWEHRTREIYQLPWNTATTSSTPTNLLVHSSSLLSSGLITLEKNFISSHCHCSLFS